MGDTVSQSHEHVQLAVCEKLRARDSATFCALYDEHVAYVYRLASYVSHDRDSPAAITEHVFRTLWQSPDVLDPRHGSTCDLLAGLVYARAANASSELGAPTVHRLRSALTDLSDSQRSALNAVYFAGHSLSTAADMLRMSVIDVARDLRAAMLRLGDTTGFPNGHAAPDVA